MNYSLNITDIAEEDILTTVRYISTALKNSIAANNLLDEIERHEKILEDFPREVHTPGIYPFVHDEYLAGKGIKYAAIKNYLMFYIIDEGLTQVKEGRVKPMKETIKSIREKIKK